MIPLKKDRSGTCKLFLFEHISSLDGPEHQLSEENDIEKPSNEFESLFRSHYWYDPRSQILNYHVILKGK